MSAFKLAAENRLSVKTNNMGFDQKLKLLSINISVSERNDDGELLRESVSYYVCDIPGNEDLNKHLRAAEEAAIMCYLGLASPIQRTANSDLADKEVEEAKEEAKEEEAKEEEAVKKPAKRTRRKVATTKKKAAKKVEAKEEEPKEEDDLLSDDGPEIELETVNYDRSDKGHQFILRPYVIKHFGAD